MKIHFSILAVIILSSLVWGWQITEKKLYYGEKYMSPILPWVVPLGYIAVLAGLRTAMNDTSVYVKSFQKISGTWTEIREIVLGSGKDKGFNILANIFKMYISDNYHWWFFIIAITESIILIYIFRRYTYSYGVAMFYFFASTIYYNYFSMMRQWFAVTLTFFGIKFIREGKPVYYILLCCVAAQIHNSAYLMIVFYFIAKGKAWNLKKTIMIAVFFVMLILLNPLLNMLGEVMEGTTYDYVVDVMQEGSGSSFIRVLIAAVPVGFAFAGRHFIEDKTIDVCVNASLLNLMLNILAVFTSGLYVIRLAVYLNLYNVILYSYMIEKIFNAESKKIIKVVFYVLYFIFFIYQMYYQGSFKYSSDIIGTFY